jgi:hypothetical protein
VPELRGWNRDPFGIHEYRFFSDDGKATLLVRDGDIRSYDKPPNYDQLPPLEQLQQEPTIAPPAPAPAPAPARPPGWLRLPPPGPRSLACPPRASTPPHRLPLGHGHRHPSARLQFPPAGAGAGAAPAPAPAAVPWHLRALVGGFRRRPRGTPSCHALHRNLHPSLASQLQQWPQWPSLIVVLCLQVVLYRAGLVTAATTFIIGIGSFSLS